VSGKRLLCARGDRPSELCAAGGLGPGLHNGRRLPMQRRPGAPERRRVLRGLPPRGVFSGRDKLALRAVSCTQEHEHHGRNCAGPVQLCPGIQRRRRPRRDGGVRAVRRRLLRSRGGGRAVRALRVRDRHRATERGHGPRGLPVRLGARTRSRSPVTQARGRSLSGGVACFMIYYKLKTAAVRPAHAGAVSAHGVQMMMTTDHTGSRAFLASRPHASASSFVWSSVCI
jgi:hypothetical protein